MEQHTTTLRRAVDGYIERYRISGRRFGEVALGDPGFVASLARGRSLRLDTADRLLVFMGEAPIGPAFRREVEAFLAVTRTKGPICWALMRPAIRPSWRGCARGSRPGSPPSIGCAPGWTGIAATRREKQSAPRCPHARWMGRRLRLGPFENGVVA